MYLKNQKKKTTQIKWTVSQKMLWKNEDNAVAEENWKKKLFVVLKHEKQNEWNRMIALEDRPFSLR